MTTSQKKGMLTATVTLTAIAAITAFEPFVLSQGINSKALSLAPGANAALCGTLGGHAIPLDSFRIRFENESHPSAAPKSAIPRQAVLHV